MVHWCSESDGLSSFSKTEQGLRHIWHPLFLCHDHQSTYRLRGWGVILACGFTFWCHINELTPWANAASTSVLPTANFAISNPMLSSLGIFKLNFECGVKKWSDIITFPINIQFICYYSFKSLVIVHRVCLELLLKINWPEVYALLNSILF